MKKEESEILEILEKSKTETVFTRGDKAYLYVLCQSEVDRIKELLEKINKNAKQALHNKTVLNMSRRELCKSLDIIEQYVDSAKDVYDMLRERT